MVADVAGVLGELGAALDLGGGLEGLEIGVHRGLGVDDEAFCRRACGR